jgi:hypothetical protein
MNDFIKDLDPKLQKLYKKQEEKEFNRLTDLMEEGRELRDSIINGKKKYTNKDIKILEQITNKFGLGLCEIVPFQGFTTFRKQYISDLKKVEKKKFLENEDKFLMRATNTNPAAMDIAWYWDIIGIMFKEENTTYSFSGSYTNQPHALSGRGRSAAWLNQLNSKNKQEKDWRKLAK